MHRREDRNVLQRVRGRLSESYPRVIGHYQWSEKRGQSSMRRRLSPGSFFGRNRRNFRNRRKDKKQLDGKRSFVPAIPDVPAIPAFFSAVRQHKVTLSCRQGVIKVEARLFS